MNNFMRKLFSRIIFLQIIIKNIKMSSGFKTILIKSIPKLSFYIQRKFLAKIFSQLFSDASSKVLFINMDFVVKI